MRIGVFDSGVGGLTVLRELLRHCPGHSTIYLGDTARVPYGSKSPQTVRRYAMLNADFLLREGIDFLVVACNTASAFAIDEMASLPIPVLGVIEPGAALAARRLAENSHANSPGDLGANIVGVLGTAGTVRSGAYDRALHSLDASIRVESIACPLFVPLAEEGWVTGPIARATAESYLAPWLAPGAARPGVVILGCTHYPLLKPVLQDVLGQETQLIDSAEAVALAVQQKLAGTKPEPNPTHRLFLTDASEGFARQARRFLGEFTSGLEPSIEVVDLEPAA